MFGKPRNRRFIQELNDRKHKGDNGSTSFMRVWNVSIVWTLAFGPTPFEATSKGLPRLHTSLLQDESIDGCSWSGWATKTRVASWSNMQENSLASLLQRKRFGLCFVQPTQDLKANAPISPLAQVAEIGTALLALEGSQVGFDAKLSTYQLRLQKPTGKTAQTLRIPDVAMAFYATTKWKLTSKPSKVGPGVQETCMKFHNLAQNSWLSFLDPLGSKSSVKTHPCVMS